MYIIVENKMEREKVEKRKKYFDEYSSRHKRRLIAKKVRSFLNTNLKTTGSSTTDKNIELQNFPVKEVIVDDNNNPGIINFENIDTIEEIDEVLEDVQKDENDEKIYNTNECNFSGACDFSDDDLASGDASAHTHTHTSDNESTSVKEVIGQLTYDLRDWTRQNKSITHTAIDQLLGLLLKNFPNCDLPKSARTLLGMTYTTKAITIQGGEYVHIGMQFALTALMNAYINASLSVNHINLSLNIDGLPLLKSSTKCFWPILISDLIKSVQVIGIFYGCNKPKSANEFISMFVNEMKTVVRDGFMYEGKIISVTLSKIICDAPAKSFLLSPKGHTGFSSCSKCTIVGRSIAGTVCFPYTESSSRLRTDEDFLQQSDEDYHRGETVLLEIPNLGFKCYAGLYAFSVFRSDEKVIALMVTWSTFSKNVQSKY